METDGQPANFPLPAAAASTALMRAAPTLTLFVLNIALIRLMRTARCTMYYDAFLVLTDEWLFAIDTELSVSLQCGKVTEVYIAFKIKTIYFQSIYNYCLFWQPCVCESRVAKK